MLVTRRSFFKVISTLAAGVVLAPSIAPLLIGDASDVIDVPDYLDVDDGYLLSANIQVHGPAIIEGILVEGLHKNVEQCEIFRSGKRPLLAFTVHPHGFAEWYATPEGRIWVPRGQSVFCSNRDVNCTFRWRPMPDGAGVKHT